MGTMAIGVGDFCIFQRPRSFAGKDVYKFSDCRSSTATSPGKLRTWIKFVTAASTNSFGQGRKTFKRNADAKEINMNWPRKHVRPEQTLNKQKSAHRQVRTARIRSESDLQS